ncbi:hypothetical protein FH972_021701 [Carpinus fangiana]|uniref:Uncharacterized protein n=1 Tax=Carpinus fangiana TaxID=176857 RepID=A0A5N6KQ22_9ROSI|nr:hypothetical protein FH972_021701 [Carpinus fangiana]
MHATYARACRSLGSRHPGSRHPGSAHALRECEPDTPQQMMLQDRRVSSLAEVEPLYAKAATAERRASSGLAPCSHTKAQRPRPEDAAKTQQRQTNLTNSALPAPLHRTHPAAHLQDHVAAAGSTKAIGKTS